MIRLLGSITAATLALGAIGMTPAQAFPPTATTSPGYDRALAESRRARGAGQPDVYAPAPRGYEAARPYPRVKRHHRRY